MRVRNRELNRVRVRERIFDEGNLAEVGLEESRGHYFLNINYLPTSRIIVPFWVGQSLPAFCDITSR